MGRAYYNEIDADAAHVLRALIGAGIIAAGDVDTRSIAEVTAADVAGYAQCHFFAGGGIWSVAARAAGWPDGRGLWTGSCPCQPFSAAGHRRGTADDRHLWPHFFRLIRAARPAVVMGEQVAGAAGYGWLDGVRADLAAEGYASRAVDIPACAVDAPHIRSRLYWCAVGAAEQRRCEGLDRRRPGDVAAAANLMADAERGRFEGRRTQDEGAETAGPALRPRAPGHLADAAGRRRPQGHDAAAAVGYRQVAAAGDGRGDGLGDAARQRSSQRPRRAGDDGREFAPALRAGRNGSFWADGEFRLGADGKARRVKSGLRLLADGHAGRVAQLRILGNAIVAPLAAEVIAAFLDAEAA